MKFLAAMLSVWSVFTSLCALATGYAHLFAARIVVGAAESTTSAAIQSLVASIFPAKNRASAMGLVYSGLAVGTGLAFVIGGYVAQHYGWRPVFLIVGLPGLLLAAQMWLRFPEPARSADGEAHEAPQPML